MKLASLVNLKPLKEEYSSEYREGQKVNFIPEKMMDFGFEDNIEHYNDLMGVIEKTFHSDIMNVGTPTDGLEIKLNKSITPPGGGSIDAITLVKSEDNFAMIGNDGGLKEGSMQARDLADEYRGMKDGLERLKSKLEDKFAEMANDRDVEPEGGPVADGFGDQLNNIDAAIVLLSPKKTPMTYDQAIGRDKVTADRDAFERSSKFDRMNESTESSWNAIDVSRKAEKEIDNKEWNERTTKKLDMLIALNKAGKFRKDWGEEKLQGWVDQNYSWERVSKQFENQKTDKIMKLKEAYSEMYETMQQGEYTAIEQGWDGLSFDEQRDIINNALSGEARPDEFEKDFDQLKSEIPDFESIVAGYLGIDEGFSPEAAKKSVISIKDNPEKLKKFLEKLVGGISRGSDYTAIDDLRNVLNAMEEEGVKLDEASMPTNLDYEDSQENTMGIDNETGEMGEGLENQVLQVTAPDGTVAIIKDPRDIGDFITGKGIVYGINPINRRPVELHIDSVLDYHYVRVTNEGSCGYTQSAPGGEELDTPGGTQGVDADDRTRGMLKKLIQKEIKKLTVGKAPITK